MSTTRDTMRRIVVGVDGSEDARRAVDWAVDEARLHGWSLELVHGVEVGVAAASPYGSGVVLEQLQDAGRQLLDAEVERVRALDVTARGILDIGSAAYALIEASRDAAMLVVGTRGHGGFHGLLLGSVSTACVHHAHCPVVVVPPDR
ncbi:MAG: universal stress protein [Ilumatobacteraceae bacterium]